jgi:Uri superfamily endonuclease
MILFWILVGGMAAALGAGVYVGLGAPGTRGRQDRVVMHGRPKRLRRRHIDWLRPQR